MAPGSSRRVVILTGAAQGIDRGIALKLAQDDFDLGLFDLPQPECKDVLEGVAATIRKEYDVGVSTIYGDVSVEEDVKRLVETVVQELGDVYAMIANAGIAALCPMHETPTETVDKLLSVNVKGVFLCYKYAAIRMIEQGEGGRIIGATSVAGFVGTANMAIYSATKFAIRGLAQTAAMEYGKYGINVNAYGPGAVRTPLMGSFSGAFSNILGKCGEPEDIAKLVSFLVSDGASFITGQSYLADGGLFFT